MKTLFTSFDV